MNPFTMKIRQLCEYVLSLTQIFTDYLFLIFWDHMQPCRLQCCPMNRVNETKTPISILLCVLCFHGSTLLILFDISYELSAGQRRYTGSQALISQKNKTNILECWL